MAAAVDEEARGTGDAARVGAVDVIGDARGVRARAQIVRELLDVDAELAGIASEVGRLAEIYVGTSYTDLLLVS